MIRCYRRNGKREGEGSGFGWVFRIYPCSIGDGGKLWGKVEILSGISVFVVGFSGR